MTVNREHEPFVGPNGRASLDSVLSTAELQVRPVRSPDYQGESRALVSLAQELATAPETVLQKLAETALEICRAGSSGVSLLSDEDGGKSFYWPAIAGAWKPHIGGGTPRDFGPCGIVLDRNATQLFSHPERYYPYLVPVSPVIEEVLLIPFYVDGTAVGTVWAVSHDKNRRFDTEDERLLKSLGAFASAVYQRLASTEALKTEIAERRQANEDLREARRAALNIMEDALAARQQTECAAGALRQSEHRYRTLFDLGPIAVYSCDALGVIRDYNHVAAELWGRAPEPGDIGERWCGSFKMLRPDGVLLPHEQCPMTDVLSGKVSEVHDAEAQIERPDGSRITVLTNIRPLKNERGEITGAINCFVDITERKRAEASLRESEQRFRTLADSVSQLAWTCDLLGNVTWYNKRWLDYTGLTFEEMKGWGWSKVQHPAHVDRVVARVQRSSETGEPWEDTFPLLGKDGQYRWFLSRALPIRNEQGNVVQWFGTNTDITEQLNAERAVREAKDILEVRVKERTSELETRNAEIVAQSNQLHELSLRLIRAQDEERRRISRELHDSVGQQLAHAKMSLEGLKRNGVTEQEAKALGHVADTLDQCLTETRTISHLLHPPLLDEVGFASAASWFVEGFSERSGIQVNFDVPTGLGRLPGDVELVLFRVLQEGLTNVHRHARTQSVDVNLQVDDRKVSLEVRDHGRGMPPELLERFKTNGGGGVGVGLNSMRERISELGGRLEVESEANGTLIRAVIPVAKSSDASKSQSAKREMS